MRALLNRRRRRRAREFALTFPRALPMREFFEPFLVGKISRIRRERRDVVVTIDPEPRRVVVVVAALRRRPPASPLRSEHRHRHETSHIDVLARDHAASARLVTISRSRHRERDAQPARRRARAGRQPPPASSRARLSRAPARDRASIITDFNVRARRRRSVRHRARIAQRRVLHDVL